MISNGNGRRLERSMYDNKIAGVCGGIAKFLDMDSTVVRLIYVLLTLFSCFSGVLVYIILLFIMPKER